MKKTLFAAVIVVAAIILAGTPAKAESITLTSNGSTIGTFACTGTNGCFGNDITLDVSGSGTSWTVTYSIDTTNNTNAGDGIAAVSFVLTGFSYVDADVTLTGAPGGAGAWTEAAGPANASGCQDSTSNMICAFDTSALGSGTGLDALTDGSTLTWTWTINNQTFGGFDSATHVQALFGDLDPNNPKCSLSSTDPRKDCFAQTGLISSATATPEPATLALFGLGLLGLAGLKRRLS